MTAKFAKLKMIKEIKYVPSAKKYKKATTSYLQVRTYIIQKGTTYRGYLPPCHLVFLLISFKYVKHVLYVHKENTQIPLHEELAINATML